VYILRSEADTNRHYVGIANNVEERLDWHNNGPCGYTVDHRPWSVAAVATTIALTDSDASDGISIKEPL